MVEAACAGFEILLRSPSCSRRRSGSKCRACSASSVRRSTDARTVSCPFAYLFILRTIAPVTVLPPCIHTQYCVCV